MGHMLTERQPTPNSITPDLNQQAGFWGLGMRRKAKRQRGQKGTGYFLIIFPQG